MKFVHDAPLPNREFDRQRGRALRENTPRSVVADVTDRPPHFDPVSLLEAQSVDRVSELVPIRNFRMVQSPFTFFRGAAVIQADDLARAPSTPIEVQLCGDAHLSNFGVFASPERRLVFDVNDFDETARGPFEWDVKRLAASVVIAGESLGLTARQQEAAALSAARSYRTSMREFSKQSTMEIWYAALDLDSLIIELQDFFSDEALRQVDGLVSRAKGKTTQRAFEKLVDVVDGRPRIAYDPPLLVPIDRMFDADVSVSMSEWCASVLEGYSSSLPSDRQDLLAQFTPIDFARKVVGVGSVGTRCFIMLLLGRDGGDPFFLQAKEANASVVDRARGVVSPYDGGERVVRGQRLMQATPDLFLGWHNVVGLDGIERSYYLRQLYDNKASINIDRLNAQTLTVYARICGWVLARAHARSGNSAEIAGYLGKTEKFDEAIASYAFAYRRRNEEDFASLQAARDSGRITTVEG